MVEFGEVSGDESDDMNFSSQNEANITYVDDEGNEICVENVMATPQANAPKSCMTIATIEESLQSCNPDKAEPPAVRPASCPRMGLKNRKKCSPNTVQYHEERRRSVRFENIEVREYNRQQDDQWVVKNGPALTLGWDVKETSHHDFEDFEVERLMSRKETRKELILSARVRAAMLKETEKGTKEVKAAVKRVLKTGENIKTQGLDKKNSVKLKKEQAVSMIERGVKKLVKKGGIKKTKGKLRDQKESVPLTDGTCSEEYDQASAGGYTGFGESFVKHDEMGRSRSLVTGDF